MFNDIIYGDVYEHFLNLTFKIQMVFEWAVTYCKFEYLLKADDDVFVNIPSLLEFLRHKDTPKNKLYAGHVNYAGKVLPIGKIQRIKGGILEKDISKVLLRW